MASGSPTDEKNFVVHSEPVWRERANFIINAALPDEDYPYRFEQLWVRQLAEERFEVCCIPFFLFDVALGDVVETKGRGDRKYVFERVVKSSGRYVFRVWFGDSYYPREGIAEKLQELGALLEWSSVNLLAVDSINSEHAQQIADFLQEQEHLDNLVYETGRSA